MSYLYIDWRGLLRERGMSLLELSRLSGVPYHRLHYMINRNSESISLETAGRVLRALGVKTYYPFILLDSPTEKPHDQKPILYHDPRHARSKSR